jgi:DNA-directed RNA polymerase specialized sigma24 family protein
MAKIKTDWQKIYLDYSPKLLGICRRYIPDLYIAEDIIQEASLPPCKKTISFTMKKLFWLVKKIVINNSLQYLRKFSKDSFYQYRSFRNSRYVLRNGTSFPGRKKHLHL